MFERIMGLNVIDDQGYSDYRDRMTPILNSYGADFGYDFVVSEVLLSKTSNKINRVFSIDFPDEATMKSFFDDPNYIQVKERYLDRSIDGKTVISMHEKSN